jgi:hypothetical protein
MRLIQSAGVPSLTAFHAFLAPVQPVPAIRKVPAERLARSCGMTSVHSYMLDFKLSH